VSRLLGWLREDPARAAVLVLGSGVLLSGLLRAACPAPVEVRERSSVAASSTAAAAEVASWARAEEQRRATSRRREVRREERRPDGSTVLEVVTEVEDDRSEAGAVEGSALASASSSAEERREERERVERRAQGRLRLHLDARWSVYDRGEFRRPAAVPELNAHALVRVAGPLSAGAWYRRAPGGEQAGGVLVSLDLGR